MGEFSETFKWELEGTKDYKTITFKGHVIAPTFETKGITSLDFKTVSFMYKCSLSFKLYNISKVDFEYKLHIPGDSSNPEEKEF